jgi:TP901 family phage tail tape measure protein
MALNNIRAGGAFIELFIKDRIQEGLKNTEKTIGSFLSRIKGLAVGGFGASAGLTLGLGVAINEVGEFDRIVRQAAAAAELTAQASFQGLKDSIVELSKETGVARESLAEIGVELARGGIGTGNLEELQKSTQAAALLQKATGALPQQVGATLVELKNQFKLSADGLLDVVDKVTVAANISAQDVQSIFESFSYAGPVAQDLGLAVDETLAYVSVLANLGIQGSNAGTALRRLLLISAASSKELGQIFDIDINEGDRLIDTLARAGDATKNLSNEARAAKFKEAFEFLGITGASGLSKSTIEFEKFLSAIQNATGAAQEQSAFIEAGLGGSLSKLVARLKEVQQVFIESLNGGELLDSLGTLTELFAEFIKENPGIAETAVKITALVGAVSALLVVFTTLAPLIGLIVTNFIPLTAALLAAGAAYLALEAGVQLVSAAFGNQISLFESLTDAVKNTVEAIKETIKFEQLAAKIEKETNDEIARRQKLQVQAQTDLVNQAKANASFAGKAESKIPFLKETDQNRQALERARELTRLIAESQAEIVRLNQLDPTGVTVSIDRWVESVARLKKELEAIPEVAAAMIGALDDEITLGLIDRTKGAVEDVVKAAVDAQLAAVDGGNAAAAQQAANLVQQAKDLAKQAEGLASVGDAEGLARVASEAAKLIDQAKQLAGTAGIGADDIAAIKKDIDALDASLQVVGQASKDISDEDRASAEDKIEEIIRLRKESEQAFLKGDLEKAQELAKRAREQASDLERETLEDQRDIAKERAKQDEEDRKNISESFKNIREASIAAIGGFNVDNIRNQVTQFDIEPLLDALNNQLEVLQQIRDRKGAVFI